MLGREADDLLFDLRQSLGRRRLRYWWLIDETLKAEFLEVSFDLIELLAGLSHNLAGLGDVSKFFGQL